MLLIQIWKSFTNFSLMYAYLKEQTYWQILNLDDVNFLKLSSGNKTNEINFAFLIYRFQTTYTSSSYHTSLFGEGLGWKTGTKMRLKKLKLSLKILLQVCTRESVSWAICFPYMHSTEIIINKCKSRTNLQCRRL